MVKEEELVQELERMIADDEQKLEKGEEIDTKIVFNETLSDENPEELSTEDVSNTITIEPEETNATISIEETTTENIKVSTEILVETPIDPNGIDTKLQQGNDEEMIVVEKAPEIEEFDAEHNALSSSAPNTITSLFAFNIIFIALILLKY